MDQVSFILVNPSFMTNVNSSFALVCKEPSISDSIKYFWNELTKKSFRVTVSESISNFPMLIYDKTHTSLRLFDVNQFMDDDMMVKLRYKEILQDILEDNYSKIKFDKYYNKLSDNFTIYLDLSDLRDRNMNFPAFKRKLLVKS